MKNNIKEWKDHLVNKGYAENTIIDYIKVINNIFPTTSKIKDYEFNIKEFFENRTEKNSSLTIDKYVAVVNKFQEFLLHSNKIDAPLDINYLYKSKNKKFNIVEILTDEELQKLFSNCNLVDKLAFTILLDTGIRISEFDYFNNYTEWIGKQTIKIAGKSKHERIIYISDRINKLALELRATGIYKIWPDSYTAKLKRIKQVADKSGIDKLTPHTFRHTFATNWIYNGHNPYLLMEALGHTSLNQLTFYVAKNQKALMEEWANNNAGKNNHDVAALKSELKYYKLETKRLKNLLEEVNNGN